MAKGQKFGSKLPMLLYTRYPIVARALGLAPLGRVRVRAKVSCIKPILLPSGTSKQVEITSFKLNFVQVNLFT